MLRVGNRGSEIDWALQCTALKHTLAYAGLIGIYELATQCVINQQPSTCAAVPSGPFRAQKGLSGLVALIRCASSRKILLVK